MFRSIKHFFQSEHGSTSGVLLGVIGALVCVLVVLNIAPEINTAADNYVTNTSATGIALFAANLAPWFFIMAGVLAAVFMVWKQVQTD